MLVSNHKILKFQGFCTLAAFRARVLGEKHADCGSSLIVFSQEDVDEYLSIDTRNSRDFPTHPVCKPDHMTSVRRHYIRLRLKSLRCHRGCLLRKSSFFTTIAMRMDIDVCRLGQSYPQANSGALI